MNRLVRRWLLPLLYFSDNWISRLGLLLVTSATVLWIFLTGANAASGYVGILQFVALPAAFFAGLFLLPVGVAWQKRREAPDHQIHIPDKVDLLNPRVRRLGIFLAATTFCNLVIGGTLTYEAVHYMETPNFCGTACHGVMGPEFRAYQAGLHKQVKCVECHVGEGVGNMVKAKLNGTRQLALLMVGKYSTPIPAPPHALKAADETCLNCHAQTYKYGERLWRSVKFNDAGEQLDTVMILKLNEIHAAHFGDGVRIDYEAADDRRSKMLRVTLTKGGQTTEYRSADYKAGAAALTRTMDCLDCHNRPSHTFEGLEHAVDQSMLHGKLDRKVPKIRAAALDVLQQKYASSDEAANTIPARLVSYFQKNAPGELASHRAEIDRAGAELKQVFARNVSPEMKITWGTYPNHIGHTDSPGCFRCHGDELKSAAAQKVISQDCESCHKALAVEEKDPKVFKE